MNSEPTYLKGMANTEREKKNNISEEYTKNAALCLVRVGQYSNSGSVENRPDCATFGLHFGETTDINLVIKIHEY